jgi:hypothetical protein
MLALSRPPLIFRRIALPGTKTDFAFHSEIQIKMSWDDDYINKRWLSEAARILGPWIGEDLEQFVVVYLRSTHNSRR